MRWYVDVTAISTSTKETYCVEAESWQRALQGARAFRGDTGPMSGFSIELLENEGCRALDPMLRIRYEVRRAPDDAAVTATVPTSASPIPVPMPPTPVRYSDAPAIQTGVVSMPASALMTNPPASATVSEGPAIQASMVSMPASALMSGAPQVTDFHSPAPEQLRSPAIPPAPIAPSVATHATNGSSASSNFPSPPAQVVFRREHDATEASPITYREFVYLVSQGTDEASAKQVLLAQFEEVRTSLARISSHKLVQLAVFDFTYSGRPPEPPIATLVWKSWRGEPEIGFPRQPGYVPISLRTPPPPSVAPTPEPPPKPAPVVAAPVVAAPVVAAPVVAAPVVAAPVVAAPVVAAPVVAAPIVAVAPVAPEPFAPVFPEPIAPQAPVVAPAPVATTQLSPAAPTKPASVPLQPAAPVAPVAPAAPAPFAPALTPPAAPVFDLQTVEPTPPPSSPVRPSNRMRSARPLGGRISGDELIADLFEAMHELHFLRDAVEAGDFCLQIVLEKIPSQSAIVHLYDIDRREFVISNARGPGSDTLLLLRHNETDSLLSEAMRKRRALILNEAAVQTTGITRYAPLSPIRSLIVSPVMQAGRFLGAIEIANPVDGKPFTDDEGNALTYLAQQLADYLATRGVVTDPERIKPNASALGR